MRYAVMIICLVVGVAAIILFILGMNDPTTIPAPMEAPVPLTRVNW
jgi:hypothetical protein